MDGVRRCFAELQDPRMGDARRHDVLEMLGTAVCTVLCGGETCTDMAEFAQAEVDFLRGFLEFEHGVPRHDTFSRVFRDPSPDL